MADLQRMQFIHHGSPTSIRSGDRMVWDFGKGTIEFSRDGGRMDILWPSGHSVTSIEIPRDEEGRDVALLLMFLCTGMNLENQSMEKDRSVVFFRPYKRTDEDPCSLMYEGCKTKLQAGDCVTINWHVRSIAFTRDHEPIIIREDARRKNYERFPIEDDIPRAELYMTVHRFLELFAGMRADRVSSTDEETTFELRTP